MKVNFNKNFEGTNGVPMTNESGKPQTISQVVAVFLFRLEKVGGHPATAEEKMQAFNLYRRISNAEKSGAAVELSTEEASMVKSVCNDNLVAGTYGQVVELIESAETKE